MEHLLGVDRRNAISTTSAVREIPEKAVRMAVEANSDPSARIRVAVVPADEGVAESIRDVAALALPTTVLP